MIKASGAELNRGPKAGKTAMCPNCLKEHIIIYGKDTPSPTEKRYGKLIGTIRCGMKSFVVSIDGKIV